MKSPRGHVITWDGLLHNRDELLLEYWHQLRGPASDATLAAMVLDRHGVRGLAKLLGEWSLTCWDPASRTLVLASDYMGGRPLYYAETPAAIHWSSSLDDLVERLQARTHLEERYLVGEITNLRAPQLTPYRGILAVPAAHCVVWKGRQPAVLSRFWDFTIAPARDHDRVSYVEQLRSLFADAVRAPLRSTFPLWIQCSGGLDSSSIVCMAHYLKHSDRVGNVSPRIESISYGSDTSPEMNEYPFISAVEEYCGLQGHHVTLERLFASSSAIVSSPRYVNNPSFEMLRFAVGRGGRLLLSGLLGDSVMANTFDCPALIAYYARHGRLFKSLSEARSRAAAGRTTIYETMSQAIPLLGPTAWAVARRHRRGLTLERDALRSAVGRPSEAFTLTDHWEGAWYSEVERVANRVGSYGPQPNGDLIEHLIRYADERRIQSPSDMIAGYLYHPYAYRPLVEFVLGVPVDILAPAGQPRGLMREAFAPFLPTKVARRISKASPEPFNMRQCRAFAERWASSVRQLKLVELGVIDEAKLTRRLENVLSGTAVRIGNLLRLAEVEQWLDRVLAEKQGIAQSAGAMTAGMY